MTLEVLFDRFQLAEPGGLNLPEGDEVSSVIAEVTRLLNARAPLTAEAAAVRSRRTVIDYGLMDFLHLSPSGGQDAQELASLVYAAVEAYEPRLMLEKVVVEAPRPSRNALCAFLTGHVRRKQHPNVPVSFSVRVGSTLAGV